ncbi:MAG: T9SS type A sorting domain-containing protein [Muribaculaceae bacterium]|nr:T9SS type A sorting domain-containing protein [Muribaculaceae bacterium]
MKKILLLASVALLGVSSAYAGKDNNTYAASNGLTCNNVWIIDRKHAPEEYAASVPAGVSAKYRTAALYNKVVYVGSSLADDPAVVDKDGNMVDVAGVDKFDMTTGAYLGKLKVTLDGVRISGQLCANQVGVDSFGNLWIAPYIASNNSKYKVYSVDKETGAATLQAELTLDLDGRIDYCDVIGDITRTNAKCVVMAAAAPPASTAVTYRWISEQGAAEWTGGWDGDNSLTIQDLYPAEQTAWSYAPTAKLVLGDDEATAYDGHLFYLDGFTTYPTLYDESGSIVDSFENAPDCVPQNAGVNGVAEFAIAGRNFIVYGNNQHTGENGGNEIWVAEMGEGMQFAGMKQVWMIPADGMNPDLTSDGGTRVHSIARELVTDATGKEGVYLLTYKCNAGFGVYLIAQEGFAAGVESTTIGEGATINVANGLITVSAEASEIVVFNAQGQLVAKANNASEIAAPAVAGAYIVKATVAGATVAKKVVL